MQPRTSITEFKKDTEKVFKKLRKSGSPILLTHRGKPKAVLQTTETFEKMLTLVDHLETLEAINQSLAEHERGEVRLADEVLLEIRKEFGIH